MPKPRSEEIEHEPFLQYTDDPSTKEDATFNGRHQEKSSRSNLISHILVFLVTSATWILVLYAIHRPSSITHASSSASYTERHNITSHAHLLTCGTTPLTAKAANCKYDVLLNAWVPAPCFSAEFIAEYTDDASWTAYADANLTQPIATIEEMSMRDTYYTSVRDHVNHCATMWKRQFWALFEERREVDGMSADPGHTDHCAQFLMDATEKEPTEATKVEVDFVGCWVRH